jgi:hypothetical protein
MIFYDTNGKLNIIDRSKLINDQLYYKKILELKSNFAKLYPNYFITNKILNNNVDNTIIYNTTLGYTSDSDSD